MQDEAKRTALVNALRILAPQRYTDPLRDVQSILERSLIRRTHDEFFDALGNIEMIPMQSGLQGINVIFYFAVSTRGRQSRARR
jgi:hypothetical protein